MYRKIFSNTNFRSHLAYHYEKNYISIHKFWDFPSKKSPIKITAYDIYCDTYVINYLFSFGQHHTDNIDGNTTLDSAEITNRSHTINN